jgi:hypothetical protein
LERHAPSAYLHINYLAHYLYKTYPMSNSIRKHFEDASSLLSLFLNDASNIAAIEKAGEAMVRAIQGGGKIIIATTAELYRPSVFQILPIFHV